jgi:hypothetical protein
VVEIKRLVPAQGVGWGGKPTSHLDFCASLSDRCIASAGAQNVELNFAVVHIISESL